VSEGGDREAKTPSLLKKYILSPQFSVSPSIVTDRA